MPPLVAVPTTAGTGSEVGRGAVIIMADGRKLGVVSAHLIPSVALCDPELTLGLPPGLTAGTGLDAIAHCIETFLAPAANPPAEAIALDGLRRASRYLERAVADGSDREARWNMMSAAMEGAMAFQKGLGAVHALSHPLGSLEDLKLHHGTLNAIFLPGVLRFNRPVVGDKWERLADAMGLPSGGDVADAVAGLNRRPRHAERGSAPWACRRRCFRPWPRRRPAITATRPTRAPRRSPTISPCCMRRWG